MLKDKILKKSLIILFILILLLNPCISTITVYATNTDTEEIIEFTDEELERQILEMYDSNSDGKISKTEIELITFLSLFEYEGQESVKDITSLQYAKNLEELQLYNVGVTDFSPLQNLTNLRSLYISSSILTDITSLESLTNITSLTLESSNLNNINSLEKLTNLQSLRISVNQSCEITVLEKLTNLKELILAGDTRVDIDVLSKLTTLEKLQLETSSSPISDISKLESLTNLKEFSTLYGLTDVNAMDTISKFTNLTNLTFRTDNVNNLEKIASLTKLENIEITINQATQIDISILENLSELYSVSIYGSSENFELVNLNNLEKLAKLQNLTLNNTNLSNLEFIKNLTTIQNLNLSNNKIEDVTPLMSLTNVRYLYLYDNKITDITGLDTLTNLQYLDLGKNLIDDQEENNAKVLNTLKANNVDINIDEFDRSQTITFNDKVLENQILLNHDSNSDGKISTSEMEEITYLNIYFESEGQHVTDLTGLEYATNLKALYINSNIITDITPIKSLSNLEELHINSNTLSDITVVKNLVNLNKFVFYGNELVDISSISELPNLKELILTSNSITDIKVLEKLVNLESLELTNDNITDITVLTNFKKLKTLQINSCPLKNIDVIGECTTLENLRLNLGNTSSISDISVLSTLTNLKELYIGYGISDNNLLETVAKFKNLIKLEVCTSEIQINSLEKISELTKLQKINLTLGEGQIDISVLGNMTELTDIFIYSNGNTILTNLNALENLSAVEYLILSGVGIENIDFIENLTELKMLNLSNNKIIDITPLGNLSKLYDLDLSNNKITSIVGLEKLTGLNYLYLRQNLINDKEENNAKVIETLKQNNVEIMIDEFDDSEIIELDAVVKEALVRIYDTNGDNEISTKEMQSVEYLGIYESGISSLKGLEYAINLQSLALRLDTSLDFSNLKNLNKLTSLDINSYNYETTIDMSSVAELTQLQELRITARIDYGMDMSFITKLINLRKLSINGGNTNLKFSLLDSLTNLEELEINHRGTNKEDILNLTNLKKLYLGYNEYNTDFSIDIISNLTNLEELEIYNLNTNLIGLEKFKKLKTLRLTTYDTELDYASMISKITSLEELNITGIINDLSYLEQLNNLKILSLWNNHYDIDTWDMEVIQTLTNLESLSLDGNLSDISGIEKLENLTFLELRHNEQGNQYDMTDNFDEEKFIEVVEKVKANNIVIGGSFNTDYIIINKGETVTINYEDISPLIKSAMNPESKLYIPNLRLTLGNYNNYPVQLDDENKTISITGDQFGDKECIIRIDSRNGMYEQTTFYGHINLRWKNIEKADNTEEIVIPDENLKNELLNNHDIDNDKKITQNDMANIETLMISNKNVQNLKGLEYAINATNLHLDNNQIVDISPLSQLLKLKYVNLENNNITDPSPLKELLSKTIDYETDWLEVYLRGNQIQDITNLGEVDFRKVDLAQNYIDFSEGSTNRQIVENSIKKYAHEEYMANPYLANYITEEEYISNELDWVFGCYIKQKYGTLAERNDVLEFEEALKNRLIELGLDANNDNELTKGELNDFESEYEMDLSNLGITNIDNLKYLSRITSLNLSNNNITDISSLKECKNIRKLNLNNNNISNISSIKDFYEIKELHLANNNITDISAIGQVESLKRIFVYDVVFTGYYDVPGRVVTIDLSNNNITDISVIANLRLLVSANLSHNKIRNINCLKDYNFATQDIPEGEEEYIDDYECLYEFEGIDLSYNYIDTSLETNQEAITVFENKGVMLNLENQDTSTLAGDVNGDGNITLADYAKILAHVKETKLLTEDEKKVADVNNDGKVTLADYAKVLAHVKETSLLY